MRALSGTYFNPDNHAQVMRTMWDYPPSRVLPDVDLSHFNRIPAGPSPERAGISSIAQMRQAMVEVRGTTLEGLPGPIGYPPQIHDIGYHKPVELASAIREFLAADIIGDSNRLSR